MFPPTPGPDDCPDAPTVERLLAGDLPPAAIDGLSAHLEGCPGCAARAGELPPRGQLAARHPDCPTGRLDDPQLTALLSAVGGGDDILEDPDELPSFDPPDRPGDLGRLGPYRLTGRLGAGGMGVVYRGEDEALNRAVAVKVLRPHFARQATARARFLREARAAAAVGGDHVVAIHQVGEADGVPFLAMELLAGESLAGRLARDPAVPVAEAVRIARGIAAGLAAAHAAGVLHRDIKPGNVWLEAGTGRVKLLDFGLAKPMTGADLTQAGELAGTPSYVAPEQAAGRPADHRADLFSLGCVLYELTTGRRPFPGETAWAALTALANTTPPRPRAVNPGVPPALDALVVRLLKKDPAGRPASAAAVAAELAAVAAGRGRSRRRPFAFAVAAVAAVAVLAAFALVRPGRSTAVPPVEAVAGTADAGYAVVWADDFERGATDWQFGYAATAAPSGVDATETNRTVRLTPKPELPANATRALGVAPPFTVAARVRYPATPPVSGRYPWRFKINLQDAAGAQPLLDDQCVVPGEWADVRVRYAVVGFAAETTVWVNGRPVHYALRPVALADAAWTHLELVAGNGDVWFDDVRLLTENAPTAAGEWSTAMAAAALDPSPATKARLLAFAEQNPADGWLAAAARWQADRVTPTLAPALTLAHDARSARAVAFTRDGRSLVTAGGDGRVRVFDTATGTPTASWATTRFVLPALAVLPDGTVLAPADATGRVQAWGLDGTPAFELRGHTEQVLSLVATSDGRTVVTAAKDGTVRRWDVTTRKAVGTVADFGRVNSITAVVSADGSATAAGSERRPAKLNGLDLVPKVRLPLALSPDGTRLAAAGANDALHLWTTADRTLVVSTADAGRTATCGSFSPDGKWLAVGRGDGGLELRDAVTARPVARFVGHTDCVYAVTFSPDGRTLASGGQDNAVFLWSLPELPTP